MWEGSFVQAPNGNSEKREVREGRSALLAGGRSALPPPSRNTPTIRVQSIGRGRLGHSGEPETIQSIK